MENYKDLLAKYLNNVCSQAELTKLISWMKNPDNEKKFHEFIENDWQSFKIDPQINPKVLSFENIRLRISSSLQTASKIGKISNNTVTRNQQIIRKILRIAASLFIPIAIGTVTYIILQRSAPRTNQIAIKKVTSPLGSKTQMELEDGTKIWLNAGSTIELSTSYNEKFREVTLTGEAFFDVAHEPKRPFIVKTTDLNIRVLGTEFNVKSYPDEGTIETTLLEGSVAISRIDQKPNTKKVIYLKPNERATFIRKQGTIIYSNIYQSFSEHDSITLNKQSRNEKMILTKNIDTEEYVAWKDNKLIFRNESLESLCIKLERWYNVKINIHDEALKHYHYTGTLHKENITQVIEAFKLTMPLKYTINHDVIDIWPTTNE